MGCPKGVKMHKYTDEQIAFLRQHKDTDSTELAELFNNQFSTQLKPKALRTTCNRNGIKSNNTGCFASGHKPWNAGLKGVNGKSNTTFKPGLIPANHKPVGTERISKDGYIEVKVAEGMHQWRSKHRVIWEQYHGPIPEGHNVTFLDSDNRNFSPDNLVLVRRAVNAQLCKKRLHALPAELKRPMISIIEIELKANALSREL